MNRGWFRRRLDEKTLQITSALCECQLARRKTFRSRKNRWTAMFLGGGRLRNDCSNIEQSILAKVLTKNKVVD